MKAKISILLLMSILFPQGIKETAINNIKDFYKNDVVINEFKFSISKKIKKEIQNKAKQAFFRDNVYYWTIKNGDNTDYAIMDNVIGKSMPITFIVMFNSNQDIIFSSIVKYREGYGGKVKSRSWLNQFNGMKKDSLYTYPKNIAGISGATISVKSVTRGMSKLSYLIPYIVKNQNEEQPISTK